jgi:hypothetical protein
MIHTAGSVTAETTAAIGLEIGVDINRSRHCALVVNLLFDRGDGGNTITAPYIVPTADIVGVAGAGSGTGFLITNIGIAGFPFEILGIFAVIESGKPTAGTTVPIGIAIQEILFGKVVIASCGFSPLTFDSTDNPECPAASAASLVSDTAAITGVGSWQSHGNIDIAFERFMLIVYFASQIGIKVAQL